MSIKLSGKAASKVLFILSFFFTCTTLNAAEISAAQAKLDPLLGGAYNSAKEVFGPQPCVTGIEVPAGIAMATFDFSNTLSERDIAQKLGVAVGARARMGLTEASMSTTFAQESLSNNFSISTTWLSEYRFQSRKLSALQLSPLGNSVASDAIKWSQSCGDEYIDEITLGARLWFMIKIEFSSIERKRSFEARFNINGPLAGVTATMEQASKEFAKDAIITVRALQIGGDISKVTGLFPANSEGRAGFVECSFGAFEKCKGVIAAAMDYATSPMGFASQLTPGARPGPNPISYITAKYSDAGINPPGANQPIAVLEKKYRDDLEEAFEKNFGLSTAGKSLMRLQIPTQQRADLAIQMKVVDSNLIKIKDAVEQCFDNSNHCQQLYRDLNLSPIDEKVFQPPPLSVASFRLYSNNLGLLSREDSVKQMNKVWRTFREVMPTIDGEKVVEHETLYDIGILTQEKGEPFSVVLFINGPNLASAELFFENIYIRSVPITKAPDRFDEKYPSNNEAMLVVDSTRPMPGWRDVNLEDERVKLWKQEHPVAEGTFYLKVKDGLGREVRFDIEQYRWSRTIGEMPGQSGRFQIEEFASRHRWWDPNSAGTNLKGNGLFYQDRAGGSFSPAQN